MQAKRWITAALLAPFVLAVNFALPGAAFGVLVILAALAAQYELLALLFGEHRERVYVAVGMVLCAAVLGVSVTGSLGWVGAAFTGAVLVSMAIHLFRFEDIATAHLALGKQLLGVMYVPLLAAFFILARMEPGGALWVVLPMLVVFTGDTGAYYVGRTWGRHALYPAVSPKKTVEGSIGGLMCSLGFGFGFRALFMPDLPLAHAAALIAVLAVFGQVGDLFESLLKRAAGIKDSGSLLPGHGGMLDRIDGVLFAGPPFYLYLKLFAT